jgi:hypothetical protein
MNFPWVFVLLVPWKSLFPDRTSNRDFNLYLYKRDSRGKTGKGRLCLKCSTVNICFTHGLEPVINGQEKFRKPF